MNLDEAFQKFLSSLEISDKQSSLSASRNNSLRDRLIQKAPFEIEKTLLIGSYNRDTQIRPRPTDRWALDVDAIAILKGNSNDIKNYFENKDGGWRLLEHTHETLKGFQGLNTEKDSPAVTVSWTHEQMKIEVVPAFKRKGGGFFIPSSSWWNDTTWKISDPIGDAEKITAANKEFNGKLKPLIKSLKCWNRKEEKVLSSFGIEVAVFHTVGSSFNGFYFELEYFFQNLLKLDGSKLSPPSGIGDPITIDLGFKKDRVERSLKLVQEAKKYNEIGKNREAIEAMAKVFGTPFPLAQTLSYWFDL